MTNRRSAMSIHLDVRLIMKATVAIVILLALCNTACREKKRVAQGSRNLAARLSSVTDRSPDPPRSDIDEQRVYLDASISMKGFVNEKKHSPFDDFIEEIGDDLPGCKLYKYGQKGSDAPKSSSELIELTTFGLELHRPGFYSLSYNPDDRLINELAKEDRSVLSVLISDGVYSEPKGSTTPPVVEAISSWISRGRVFGILIFRSSFSGPFYSERLRTVLPTLSVASRPFYAFVFSPTERGFRELQGKLQRRFPAIQSVVFSDESVSCSVELDEHIRGTYSFAKPPSVPYYWQMFDADLFAKKVPAEVGYHLKYVLSPEYSATEFKADVTPEFYRWEKGDFRKVEGAPPSGFSVEVDPKKTNTGEKTPDEPNRQKATSPLPDFVVYYPKDSSSDYGFYRLRVNSSPKSLRQDIQDLSTRDDGVRENANKTFRIFELITALTDVHFKTRLAQRTSPEIFATVANH
jgi:hypothetical protein